MITLKNDERETILLYNPMAACWEVSTSVPAHMNRFRKLGWELVEDLGYEVSFRIPKNAIMFRDLRKVRKPQTEEQKAIARERMKRIRAEQLASKTD